MNKTKIGIIQSRGLGDIIIALPIARHYYDQGNEIIWPICSEFLASFKTTVPWVTWVGIETDARGDFFLNTPLQVLAAEGVAEEDQLYLYQYLNTRPDLTDPELFNILKFDQYKYWTAGVPFLKKWTLRNCIVRDRVREAEFKSSLNLQESYAVTHFKGSSFAADIDVNWLDPAVKIINIDEALTDNIWDWLGVIEGSRAFIGIDSVFANMVDQMQVAGPDLYWIRRSHWDLTPVLGEAWTMVPTDLTLDEPQRVNVLAQQQQLARTNQQRAGDPVSHAPFQAAGTIPTSFMSALKPNPNGTGNLITPPTQQQPPQQPQPKKSNPAVDLYRKLGARV